MELSARWEQEAIGASWAAGQALLLRREARPLCWQAGVLCERYARHCFEQAIATLSPAWACEGRVYRDAALVWMQLASVRNSGQ